jgi:hypothetical protein
MFRKRARRSAGVEEVKVDAGAGKVTVKGFGFDVEKLRAKVEKGCRKKVELVVPAKKEEDVVTEVKTKEEVQMASVSDNNATYINTSICTI